MHFDCAGCGAKLKVNPKLAGTTIPCPQCGARLQVPDRPRRRVERVAPVAERDLEPARRPSAPYTVYLFFVQTLLFLLGLTCFLGAFFKESWNPPMWSYFRDEPVVLLGAGMALMVATVAARQLPILAALGAAVVALTACGLRFYLEGTVDASRVLALSATMLILWLALQHRRAVTPATDA